MNNKTLYCSFCGKSQHEVRVLVAGPTVFICDECVELCSDTVRERTGKALTPTEAFNKCFNMIGELTNKITALLAVEKRRREPFDELEKGLADLRETAKFLQPNSLEKKVEELKNTTL